jgi:ligand-binding sensor domain-containing protein
VFSAIGWQAIFTIHRQAMKLTALFFFCMLSLLTSCSGQTTHPKENPGQVKAPIATGDTVKELGSSIMIVYQDKKNVYWFGSWETGVYRYDGKTLLNYTTQHGLPNNRVDEILEDQSGNIYFNACAPNSTIAKFDGNTFTTLTAIPSNDWKLQATDVWFRHAFQNEKVYRYDGMVLHELQVPKPPNLSNPFEIYSIYKDRMGNVWFGTNPSGVCRYDGKTFDWITEEDVTEFRDEPANGVRSMIEDENGDFWFNAEYRYRIYGSSASTGAKFYRRQESIGSLDGKNTPGLNEYLSVAKDNQHDLWFATYRSGVWKYDGKTVTHYPVQKDGQDITIFRIYKDNLGHLWLGTHENGAFQFNGSTFEKFRPS